MNPHSVGIRMHTCLIIAVNCCLSIFMFETIFIRQQISNSLVLSMCVPPVVRNGLVKKSNSLGLFPQSGKEKGDFEIGNYYVALSLQP